MATAEIYLSSQATSFFAYLVNTLTKIVKLFPVFLPLSIAGFIRFP
jgi:hypothetical protein